jgi:hypothetical protein
VATSTSLEGRTKPLSGDFAEPLLGWLRHRAPPFILAYDIPRGILQLVVASLNFLFMLTIMWVV